jgi:hypothetical protein
MVVVKVVQGILYLALKKIRKFDARLLDLSHQFISVYVLYTALSGYNLKGNIRDLQ